ncbi:MAG: MBL fold metallo-hydrolase, partial [Gemmatimonadaceae bacterium]
MRVMSLGHAGLLIEAAGVRIACDPWLSERGAFLGGWFQLPQNHHLKSQLIDGGLDVLYVSHGHLDHFDLDTLRDLPRDLTLVVASFPSRPWVEQVRALGFREVLFLDGEKTAEVAPGVHVQVITEDSAYFADSALIVEADGQVLVNLNDCHISEPQAARIVERHPRIAAVFAQFSGANWYPFVYDFPEQVRIEAARNKVQNSFLRWKRYMDGLQPAWAVPFAGPPALLDPDTRRYLDGPDSIFPLPPALISWLAVNDPPLCDRTLPLLPGDWLHLPDGRVERDEAMHAEFAWDRLASYIDRYVERMAPAIAAAIASFPWPRDSLFSRFSAYFQGMLAAGPRLATRVDARVLFDIEGDGGGRWLVDFRELAVRDLSFDRR